MKSVSVIVPFYNGERYFGECLASVLNQNLKPDEIIVVDDGSGPSGREFLKQFLSNMTLITLPKNVGVARARNAGVAQAHGEWIALLDQDDIWEPRKLEAQADYVQHNPECDALHTGITAFSEDGAEFVYANKPRRLALADALTATHVIPSSLIIRTDVMKAVGGFDGQLHRGEDDYDFVIRLVKSGYHIEFIPEPLVRYRIGHPQKQSGKLRHFYGHCIVIRKHKALFEATLGPGSAYRQLGRLIVKAGRRRSGLVGRLISGSGYVVTSWGTLLGAVRHPRV